MQVDILLLPVLDGQMECMYDFLKRLHDDKKR